MHYFISECLILNFASNEIFNNVFCDHVYVFYNNAVLFIRDLNSYVLLIKYHIYVCVVLHN